MLINEGYEVGPTFKDETEYTKKFGNFYIIVNVRSKTFVTSLYDFSGRLKYLEETHNKDICNFKDIEAQYILFAKNINLHLKLKKMEKDFND